MNASLDDANRLRQIAADHYGGSIDRDAARSAVCGVILERLRCARVSLWRFEAGDDHLVLECVGAERAGGAFEKDATRLAIDEFRDYFAVLSESGVFVADDAAADPALQAMRAKYLEAQNVVSMLDAAFLINGRAFGVICCEETATPRRWSGVDVRTLRAIAARIAMLMASYSDPSLWTGASLPLDPIAGPASDRRR